MRALAVSLCTAAVVLPLFSCSPLDGISGFGNRVSAGACAASAAPWLIPAAAVVPSAAEPRLRLRAVTYNIHSGLGPYFALRGSRATVESNLRRIAEAIAATAPARDAPDVVALNEVDFAARRSGNFDQARFIAGELGRLTGYVYEVISGETWRRRIPGFEVRFGNAVLVRHAVISAAACAYVDADECNPVAAPTALPALRAPGLRNRIARENRGLIKLGIDFHGVPMDVVVTHLEAFIVAEREAQAAHLVRRFIDPVRTTLLLGDFNTVPTVLTQGRTYFAADRTHDILTSGSLADARILYASVQRRAELSEWATYPASAPKWPLDSVLGSLDLVPTRVVAVGTTQSDHRGLAVDYVVGVEPGTIALQRARHDAIRRRQLAQILSCDLVAGPQLAARTRWLLQGTGFLEIASSAERQRLAQAALSPPL